MREKLTEKQMVGGLKAGNHWVFETFVREYERMVYGVCFKFLHSCQEAEDIVQDVFVKAYEKIGGFQEKSKLSSWLYRITVNECMMYLRKESKRNSVHTNFYKINQSFFLQKNPFTILQSKELKMTILESIAELNEKEKKAIVMRVLEEKSNGEVASILGISVAAAKSRFHRGKIKVQKGKIGKYVQAYS